MILFLLGLLAGVILAAGFTWLAIFLANLDTGSVEEVKEGEDAL